MDVDNAEGIDKVCIVYIHMCTSDSILAQDVLRASQEKVKRSKAPTEQHLRKHARALQGNNVRKGEAFIRNYIIAHHSHPARVRETEDSIKGGISTSSVNIND